MVSAVSFPTHFDVADFVLVWATGVSRFLTKGIGSCIVVSVCHGGKEGMGLPVLPPCSLFSIVILALSVFVPMHHCLN